MIPYFIPSTPTWAPSSPNSLHSLFRQASYSQWFRLPGSPGSLASATFLHPSPELLTPHLPLFAGKGKKKTLIPPWAPGSLPGPPSEGGRPENRWGWQGTQNARNAEKTAGGRGAMPPHRTLWCAPRFSQKQISVKKRRLVFTVNGSRKSLRQVSSPLQALVSTPVKWARVSLC